MSGMRRVLSCFAIVLALGLAGCSSNKQDGSLVSYAGKKVRKGGKLDPFAGYGSSYYKGKGRVPRGGGKVHIGKPYQIGGKWFKPKAQPGYDKSGMASWYGEAFHRRKTSNGEYFDMAMLTAAHPTLPLPSYARVTNLANGKSIVVRINDRGPFVDTRVIDLSKRTAEVLDFKNKGKAKVRVQWIGMAPINDQGGHLAMMNKRNTQGSSMGNLIAAADGGEDRVQVADVDTNETVALQQASYAPKPKLMQKSNPVIDRGSAYVIQVGSFANLDNAESVRTALSDYGAVQVYEYAGDDSAIYKVQMGPFLSSIGAQDALDAVRQAGFPDARLSKTRIEQVSANSEQ